MLLYTKLPKPPASHIPPQDSESIDHEHSSPWIPSPEGQTKPNYLDTKGIPTVVCSNSSPQQDLKGSRETAMDAALLAIHTSIQSQMNKTSLLRAFIDKQQKIEANEIK